MGKQEINYCAVFQLTQYLYLIRKSPGPLFISPEGSHVNRAQFTHILNQSLSLAGLPSSRYKSHSFRIGARSFAMERGKSDAQSRALGRWKSNAFLKYILPQIGSLWVISSIISQAILVLISFDTYFLPRMTSRSSHHRKMALCIHFMFVYTIVCHVWILCNV
jgi:hypothetical protein